MNQFKDCFLGGEKRAYSRAATCQKCLRISGKHNDLENVGVTARHHTFFEMLGNFSFGDYFKKDAIKMAWEFITQVLKLPKSRLWVTIFEEDDEAGELWRTLTDIEPHRILKLGAKDNFWAMGDTGPCGPCTEIHYYIGEDEASQSEEGFRRDDGTYLEFWNNVFMQFDRSADGKLVPLPKPAVDTGMGLERVTAILQGKLANYDTDLLRPVISTCEELSGIKYDGASYVERDLKKDKAYARDVAMRVIADHSRATAFLIADGCLPGSEGRGYVLRRVIRRAVRHGRVLNFKEPFLKHTCARVVEMMGDAYPELVAARETILRVADAEERKFHETLDSGLAILNKEVEKLPSGKPFPGEIAFLLHDTYGFPLDLTDDALKVHHVQVDHAGFERAMEDQKKRSRDERKSQGLAFTAYKFDSAKTEFLGYEKLSSESKLVKVLPEDGSEKSRYGKGDKLNLLFDATPFYAESGGQVGDTGVVTLSSGRFRVLDTQKVQDGFYLHYGEVIDGELVSSQAGEKAALEVDADRRARIRTHHSATHLVHTALREVLGQHVKQAGSRVDDSSLRFDYSHFEPVSFAQLEEIQGIVNELIRENHEVNTRVLPIEEARKTGAVALFGEKYGSTVRVVEMGPRSIEFCGGTHARRSGDIGFIMVSSETGVSSGVRRIECFAGAAAQSALRTELSERAQIAELLKSDTTNLPEKVDRLLQKLRTLERELEAGRSKLASAASSELVQNVRVSPGGIKVIAERVDAADSTTLRTMVDRLRQKIGSGVVALGSNQGEQAVIVAGVTSDLTQTINAGKLVQEAAKHSGGRGGGKADFAQAGGVDPSRLGVALDKLFESIA
jgi:alanyl-tRNA synthetase